MAGDQVVDPSQRRALFETKSHVWADAGLADQVAVRRAARARRHIAVVVPLLVAALVAYRFRQHFYGLDLPIRVATVAALMALGWTLARDVGRALAPVLFRRLDPGTAGTVGFVVRLAMLAAAVFGALAIAGVQTRTLAVGGALTAVVLGLAAQQTLAHLIAGMIILSVRPFRVGDRVRLQAGNLAGEVEGVVASLGLLYTTFLSAEQTLHVPNGLVLNSAITVVSQPDAVELRATLPARLGPRAVERLVVEAVSVPLRESPDITLEEVGRGELRVRVTALPRDGASSAELADELYSALAGAAADEEARGCV